MKIYRAFVTAVRTLTILPVPGRDAERLVDALYYFPLIGLLVGGLVTLAAWLVGGVLNWSAGAGVAAVVVSSWVTRGLHLDGLGDTVDGYYGGATRERRLEIMKDHHVGAFGVVAIALALLIKAAAVSQMAIYGQWAWIPVPFVLARLTQVLLAVTLPYARNEGGTAEVFIKQAGVPHFVVAGLLALALCGLLAQVGGVFLFVLTFLAGHLVARRMKRVFGGATGDLLGFASELIECVLLFLLAAVMPFMENGVLVFID
jgi:adenosylcobinamide-GDP ribazoletransferase